MRLNLRFFASLQFWLGLLLAGSAVVAFLVLGRALNPAPLRIVVAREDIQRGDTITEDVLAISKQHLDVVMFVALGTLILTPQLLKTGLKLPNAAGNRPASSPKSTPARCATRWSSAPVPSGAR